MVKIQKAGAREVLIIKVKTVGANQRLLVLMVDHRGINKMVDLLGVNHLEEIRMAETREATGEVLVHLKEGVGLVEDGEEGVEAVEITLGEDVHLIRTNPLGIRLVGVGEEEVVLAGAVARQLMEVAKMIWRAAKVVVLLGISRAVDLHGAIRVVGRLGVIKMVGLLGVKRILAMIEDLVVLKGGVVRAGGGVEEEAIEVVEEAETTLAEEDLLIGSNLVGVVAKQVAGEITRTLMEVGKMMEEPVVGRMLLMEREIKGGTGVV